MAPSLKTAGELALEVAVFAAVAGEVALFHGNPPLLAALLVVTAVLVIAVACRPVRHAVALYAVGAVLGPGGEMIAMSTGTWRYAEPDFLGIPMWLPFGWGVAAVVIGRIAATLSGRPDATSSRSRTTVPGSG
jgi:hypothetical protein